MNVDTPCPRCGEDVTLVDPTGAEWSLNAGEYDEDAEVWLCVACGWNEEATFEEALEEHAANLEWAMARVQAIVDETAKESESQNA